MGDPLELDVSGLGEDLVLNSEIVRDAVALLSAISEIDTQFAFQLDRDDLVNCKTMSETYPLIRK